MGDLVVYREACLLVAEKPAGLLSVPGRGPDKADCLFARLREEYPELRTVHRLDQATSGLMVWARSAEAQRALGRQFEAREVKKSYEALVEGRLPDREGTLLLRQRLDPDNRPLQVADPLQGKEGETRWEVLEEGERFSRVALFPRTGRTHQLRLHMAHLGCPILGDTLYGRDAPAAGRMCLHARSLEFYHPLAGGALRFESPVPF